RETRWALAVLVDPLRRSCRAVKAEERARHRTVNALRHLGDRVTGVWLRAVGRGARRPLLASGGAAEEPALPRPPLRRGQPAWGPLRLPARLRAEREGPRPGRIAGAAAGGAADPRDPDQPPGAGPPDDLDHRPAPRLPRGRRGRRSGRGAVQPLPPGRPLSPGTVAAATLVGAHGLPRPPPAR